MGLCFLPMKFRKERIRIHFPTKQMKNVKYSALKKSEKFTPALYHEKDGVWEGAV